MGFKNLLQKFKSLFNRDKFSIQIFEREDEKSFTVKVICKGSTEGPFTNTVFKNAYPNYKEQAYNMAGDYVRQLMHNRYYINKIKNVPIYRNKAHNQ